jgi:hypothetical protein
MKIPSFFGKLVAASVFAASLLVPPMAQAATTTYAQDTDLTIGGVPLVIKDGSAADSFTSTDTSFTVSVPSGEVFEVRTVGGRNQLENDGMLPNCDVLKDLTNRLIVNGPRQVTVTPSAVACSSTGYDTNKMPSYLISAPAAGATVKAGQNFQMFWSTSGSAAAIQIRLSTDGGMSYPTTLADGGFIDNGFFSWNVPMMPSTNSAKLMIEGINSGNVVGFSTSPLFSIAGTAAAVVASPSAPAPAMNNQPSVTVTPYVYDPLSETQSAATISIDKKLTTASSSNLVCLPDSRIKVTGSDAIYYCGTDGKRYVFPNLATYDSWYGGFAGVIDLDLATMEKIPLGGNVTYRPGVKLVKITSSPEVFAVGADATLRYVSEKAAVRLYGPNWSKNVDDLPDAFFTNYHIGDAIME